VTIRWGGDGFPAANAAEVKPVITKTIANTLCNVKEGAVKVVASEKRRDAYLNAPGVVGVYACTGVTPMDPVVVTCYNKEKVQAFESEIRRLTGREGLIVKQLQCCTPDGPPSQISCSPDKVLAHHRRRR